MRDVMKELEMEEMVWKEANTSWKENLAAFERFKNEQKAIKARCKVGKSTTKQKSKRRGDNKGEDSEEEKVSRLVREREAGSAEHNKWQGFDPRAPINGFHFANAQKLLHSELHIYKQQLRDRGVAE